MPPREKAATALNGRTMRLPLLFGTSQPGTRRAGETVSGAASKISRSGKHRALPAQNIAITCEKVRDCTTNGVGHEQALRGSRKQERWVETGRGGKAGERSLGESWTAVRVIHHLCMRAVTLHLTPHLTTAKRSNVAHRHLWTPG